MNGLYSYSIVLITLIIGLSSPAAQAVNAYKPGFYLSLEGDSIRGYVKFNNRIVNEARCYFKSDRKSKPQKFTPTEITGYGIDDGKTFLSRRFPEDRVSFDKVDQSVFMELLQKGRLKLFRYQDRFFIEYDKGQKFRELISTVISKNIGYRVYEENLHEFIDVLEDAMGDCPSISKGLRAGHRRITLSERDLMKLMAEYHGCVRETLVQPDRRSGLKVSFGPVIGGGETQISYRPTNEYLSLKPTTNSAIYSLVNTEYTPSRSAMMGFFVDISFPRGFSGLGVHAEILYRPLQFLGENAFSISQNSRNDPHDIEDELEIRLHKIIIPISLRKTFGTGPRPIYVGAGFNVHMNVGRTYILYRDMNFTNTGTRFLSTERPWADNNFEAGLWANIGWIFVNTGDRQLSFEFRVEQSSAKNRLNSWPNGPGTNRYQLRSASFVLSYGLWSSKGSTSR